jgi:hypothetical protein
MDISDIKRLNRRWPEVYPYLAKQVISFVMGEPWDMLEMGPFSDTQRSSKTAGYGCCCGGKRGCSQTWEIPMDSRNVSGGFV